MIAESESVLPSWSVSAVNSTADLARERIEHLARGLLANVAFLPYTSSLHVV